jgi:hypothetical protein
VDVRGRGKWGSNKKVHVDEILLQSAAQGLVPDCCMPPWQPTSSPLTSNSLSWASSRLSIRSSSSGWQPSPRTRGSRRRGLLSCNGSTRWTPWTL